MTPPETAALATEIANLRGDINGFRNSINAVSRDLSDIKTSCAVLVARSDRTEQDVRDLRRELEDEIKKIRDDEIKPLKAELAAAKGRQWPLPSIAAVCGVAGVATSVFALLSH